MAEPEETAPDEEVVVQLASLPQIISSESIVGGAAGSGAARAATSAAGVELGRRLLLAARAGDTAQLLDLMAQGAPFTTDWLGTSALHLAALGGHSGAAGVLLRAGVSRDARTKVERTPLHLAAHAGHADVARVLLDHGAMLECRDMLRMTPLHWAAARGHAALAAALVARGADVRARCKFRRTPLQLAARHDDVRRAIKDAMLQREQNKRQEEAAADDPMERKAFEAGAAPAEEKPAIKLTQKVNKQNSENEPRSSPGGGSGAAALLRQHGITLLPADDGSTVLSALQSGRTVVLSDAGKLMLKENSSPPPAPPSPSAPSPSPVPPPPPPAPARAGVVLRACPAREPPRPGVKVFTVNKLPRLKQHQPVAKVQGNKKDVQIKYVQLPPDATLVTPGSPRSGNTRMLPTAAPAGAGNRPGVKIIMNKASFGKLLATATRAHGSGDNEPLSLSCGGAREAVVCVPEQFVRSSSARYLRAQLLAAHAALHELQRELRQARAALAAREPG